MTPLAASNEWEESCTKKKVNNEESQYAFLSHHDDVNQLQLTLCLDSDTLALKFTII